MAVGEFQASLIDSHELAPGVRHFVFEAPEPLEYAPGQFVSLNAEVDGKPVKRAYSIASPPRGSRFALCLNRVCEGVFSPHLFDLQPGAKVKMKGPYGVFGWREPVNDSVLVAAGTGIAPFRAMLQGRVPEDPGRRFTLVFGVREERGVLYRVEFERLAARCPGFRFWPTLTRPEPSWRGRTGRVQQHLAEAVGERRDLDVYICGVREMVEDVHAALDRMGFERRRVIYERYD